MNIISFPTDICFVARSLDAVGAPNGCKLLPTHNFANPPSLDILLIPGMSYACPFLGEAEMMQYLRDVYPSVECVIMISAGSVLFAKTGLLSLPEMRDGSEESWEGSHDTGGRIRSDMGR